LEIGSLPTTFPLLGSSWFLLPTPFGLPNFNGLSHSTRAGNQDALYPGCLRPLNSPPSFPTLSDGLIGRPPLGGLRFTSGQQDFSCMFLDTTFFGLPFFRFFAFFPRRLAVLPCVAFKDFSSPPSRPSTSSNFSPFRLLRLIRILAGELPPSPSQLHPMLLKGSLGPPAYGQFRISDCSDGDRKTPPLLRPYGRVRLPLHTRSLIPVMLKVCFLLIRRPGTGY